MTYVRSDRARNWSSSAYENARIKAGLTYEELARRIGVGLTTAHRWANGDAPPRTRLAKIAHALRVPAALLTPSGPF